MGLTEKRLYQLKRFALPIPEALIAITGLILVFVFPEDQFFELNGLAVLAFASGVIAIPLSIPLVFIKVHFFWFDIAYIVAGLLMIRFVETLPDGPNFGAGALAFLGFSFMISGGSSSLRRLRAVSFLKRRD